MVITDDCIGIVSRKGGRKERRKRETRSERETKTHRLTEMQASTGNLTIKRPGKYDRDKVRETERERERGREGGRERRRERLRQSQTEEREREREGQGERERDSKMTPTFITKVGNVVKTTFPLLPLVE